MNDQQQQYEQTAPQQAAGRAALRHAAPARSEPQPKKQARRPKQFDSYRSVMDVESFVAPKPEGAKLVIAPGIEGGHFVPVSFVAKDWNVTPRRIRALLCEGRLLGRLQVNGYWEVRFPYSFTFGTRGPGLKRQQKQERRAA